MKTIKFLQILSRVNKNTIKKYFKEGIIWSMLWSIFLTPYSLIIEELTVTQYLYWILMEFILVLPLSPIINKIGKYIFERC